MVNNLEVINDLWLQIDKLHLSYLQTEESPDRIEQKRKLEGCMKEYLCLVTANQRFYSATTKAVLYSSILHRSEQFSPAKFSHAWEMLGTYAANLLGQPWRKEFKEIRMYSGAFKYQIEQYLMGAEEILMEMGYTLDLEFNRLIVQGMLDYDRIVRCHRDCLLAQVESLILSEIHSSLSVSLRPCSWATIFDYRDSYVGSVGHCVRGLMYQQAQKENQLGYIYSNPAPGNHYLPLGPHEVYPNNYSYQQTYQPIRQAYAYSYASDQTRGAYLPKTLPCVEDPESPSYPLLDTRSLEEQVQEPFEIWNTSTGREVAMKSVPKFDSLLDIERLEQLCYDEVDNHQSSIEKAKDRLRKERATSTKNVSVSISDNKSKIPTVVPPSPAVRQSVKTQSGARPKENSTSNGTNAKDKSVSSDPSNKLCGWECLFCTYFNKEDREICDMCAKSRHKGSESRPLFRGGRECSNCTLVNPPDEERCAACSTSLIHAPTYI